MGALSFGKMDKKITGDEYAQAGVSSIRRAAAAWIKGHALSRSFPVRQIENEKTEMSMRSEASGPKATFRWERRAYNYGFGILDTRIGRDGNKYAVTEDMLKEKDNCRIRMCGAPGMCRQQGGMHILLISGFGFR